MNLSDLLYDYAGNHSSPEPEWLRIIDCDTNLQLLNPRMCSGHIQGRFLKLLCSIVNPERALDIGTFSGYSALCLAEALKKPNAYVDTIESDDELEDFIRQHIALAPSEIASRIHLHIGDAIDIIPSLQTPWQLVFIDADKRRYNDYLDLLLPRLDSGCLILADNTLWGGNVIDAAHDKDAQTVAIRSFNQRVASDSRFDTVMLPLRDGLTLIRLK